jgi:exopolysaccharide production protein ExoZ
LLKFIKKRLTRIVPLYWFYTSLFLFLFLLILFPNLFGNYKMGSTEWTISSYLFFPAYNYRDMLEPILSIGWTLHYEIFFYFVFGIFLLFDKKYLLILPLIFVLFLQFNYQNYILNYYFNSIIIEFLFGLLIAVLYEKYNIKNKTFLFTSLLLGILLLLSNIFIYYNLNRFIVYGLPWSIVFISIIYLEKNYVSFKSKLIVLIGDASYSIYLSHIFTIGLVSKLISNSLLFIFCSLILSTVVGILSYLLLEKQFTKISNKVIN